MQPIAAGVLLLLDLLGILDSAALVWPLIFAAAGTAFLTVFFRSRADWWAAIPGSVFLGLAAVILITQIEGKREDGRTVWDAVLSASSSRLRPMSLTAISTVLGLIPIAPTVFWGPMAFAIMGGLLVATMLTLVFLPTVYVTWFRGKEAAADAPAPAPAPSATA